MRTQMTKEVTFTTCKVAEMVIENGMPKVIERDSERFLGNASMAKITRELRKMYKKELTPFDIKVETFTYVMDVEDFIKHATLKEDDSE